MMVVMPSYIYILFQLLFSYRLSQNIEYILESFYFFHKTMFSVIGISCMSVWLQFHKPYQYVYHLLVKNNNYAQQQQNLH